MHSGVRNAALALSLGLALLSFGCAKQVVPAPYPVPPRTPFPAPPDRAQTPPPASPGQVAPAPSAPPPAAAPVKPSARVTASLNLTEQGRQLLAQGQTDAAISTLERASSLNPSGGQNYYWLAQAWLVKGDPAQAAIYHRQARRYLNADPAWGARLNQQARALGGR